MDDTQPIVPIPAESHAGAAPRLIKFLMFFGAVVLVSVAAIIALWPQAKLETNQVLSPTITGVPSSTQPASSLGIASVEYATPLPSPPPPIDIPPVQWVRPTAAAQDVLSALNAPLPDQQPGTVAIARQINPLTIQPVRSRDTVINYLVKRGDNLQSIAQRFGLDESTIIWSNARFYVNAMRVGMELTIPPVDGVYHSVQQPQTIQAIADQYAVDPYAIIDAEYNGLFGTLPESMLPEGMHVVVPGGTGSTEPIYWDPGIEMAAGDVTSGGSSAAGYASFGGDDPGSCGRQPVQGGSPPYSASIWANYSITQDFSWSHGGIDLAVPPGTSVYAAGGGTVVFAGWSSWGYGYAVVIAHGSTMSIYGHLNGPLVACGQVVSAGQGIGVTGNTGRSSGPHLHFEIRGADGKPVNPWDYQSF